MFQIGIEFAGKRYTRQNLTCLKYMYYPEIRHGEEITANPLASGSDKI